MTIIPAGIYDLFDVTKRFRRLLFRPDKVIQTREFNELQRNWEDRFGRLAGALLAEGDVVEGCAIAVDAAGAATVASGAVFLRGLVADVPAGALTIPTAATVTVGLRYVEDCVTEVEDPSLRNPAVGTAVYGEPGAARLRWTVAWGWAQGQATDGGPGELIPVYTVVDGVVGAKLAPKRASTLRALAQLDYDSRYFSASGEALTVNIGNVSADIGMPEVVSSLRTRATADLVLYCAPTGSDSTGDGTAAKPFRQPQAAHDHALANLDLAGRQLTIKLADGAYDSVSLGLLGGHRMSNAVTGVNSTLPTLEGNTGNPAAVVIDGSGNTSHGCGVLVRQGGLWRVRGATTKGATYGACAHEGGVHMSNCRYDAAPWGLICALAGGFVFLSDGGRIVAGSEAALLAYGGGTIYAGTTAQTWYVENNPQFTKGFLTTGNGARQVIDAITFSGSARGKRHYTENGCVVYVAGKTCPGDTAGTTPPTSYVG